MNGWAVKPVCTQRMPFTKKLSILCSAALFTHPRETSIISVASTINCCCYQLLCQNGNESGVTGAGAVFRLSNIGQTYPVQSAFSLSKNTLHPWCTFRSHPNIESAYGRNRYPDHRNSSSASPYHGIGTGYSHLNCVHLGHHSQQTLRSLMHTCYGNFAINIIKNIWWIPPQILPVIIYHHFPHFFLPFGGKQIH